MAARSTRCRCRPPAPGVPADARRRTSKPWPCAGSPTAGSCTAPVTPRVPSPSSSRGGEPACGAAARHRALPPDVRRSSGGLARACRGARHRRPPTRRSRTRCSRRRCSSSCRGSPTTTSPRKLDAARRALEAVDRAPHPDPEVLFQVRAALVEAEFYAGLGIHLERLDGLDRTSTPRFPPVRTASHGDDLVGRLLAYDGRIDEGLTTLRVACTTGPAWRTGRFCRRSSAGWPKHRSWPGASWRRATSPRRPLDRTAEIGGTAGSPVGGRLPRRRAGQAGPSWTRPSRRRARCWSPLAPIQSWGWTVLPARLALGIVAVWAGRTSRRGGPAAHPRRDQAAGRDPRATIVCPRGGPHRGARRGGRAGRGGGGAPRLDEEAETSRQPVVLGRRGTVSRRCLLAARGRPGRSRPGRREVPLQLFEGLPMPFERARTLLLLGQLRRRRREKGLARDALREALAAFEDLHAPIWAERARDELARIPDHADRPDPDPDRGASRPAGSRRADQPTDRGANVPQPEDRRGQPDPGLPQAREYAGRLSRTGWPRGQGTRTAT